MLSLAPFKYRAILEDDGGPVRLLEASRTTLWDGTPCYAAAAYLSPSLRPPRPRRLGIYDDADGGGTSRSRNKACFIAVSEALERWAYYAASTGPARDELGFGADNSTTGMAAFPGFTARTARRNARLEAAERWSVLEWWRGALHASPLPPGIVAADGVEIAAPFPDTRIVVIWASSPKFGGPAFGFAAGASLAAATERAGVELTRNLNALGRFYEQHGARPSDVDLGSVSDRLERRLVYFSTPRGFASFLGRVKASAAAPPGRTLPVTLVDREVRGPWTRYARAWRVLYRHAGGADDETDVDVFAF